MSFRPCHVAPEEMLCALFEFISYLPPTLSLSLWVLLLSQQQRGTAFPKTLRSTELSAGPSPFRESVVIYPDSGCHSSPGSRLPELSLVASLPSMMEKISMLHTGSLSYDKKQVLLNKPDVNNCWKQYRALRCGVRLVFCLAVSEVAQFPSGPEMPF